MSGATAVTYDARLEPKGLARLTAPLLALAFRRIESAPEADERGIGQGIPHVPGEAVNEIVLAAMGFVEHLGGNAPGHRVKLFKAGRRNARLARAAGDQLVRLCFANAQCLGRFCYRNEERAALNLFVNHGYLSLRFKLSNTLFYSTF